MNRVIVIPCLLLVLGATKLLAVSFDNAYQQDANYQTALRAVATAQDTLTKVLADPTAPVVSIVVAREGVEEAKAKLALTSVTAQHQVNDAVFAVLVARRKAAVSVKRLELARVQLTAAEIRFKAGAISSQELARANESCSKITIIAKTDQRNVDVAEAQVKAYVGQVPTDEYSSPAPLDITKISYQDHVTLLIAKHQVSAAERALALAQGPDTAPLDKAARERELAGAKDAFRNSERTVLDSFNTAKSRYLAAQETFKVAQDTDKLAQADYQSAKKRLAAGAISQVDMLTTEVAMLDAKHGMEQSLSEYWQAQYALFEYIGGTQQ